jgi:hypothetical protein
MPFQSQVIGTATLKLQFIYKLLQHIYTPMKHTVFVNVPAVITIAPQSVLGWGMFHKLIFLFSKVSLGGTLAINC